MSYILEREGFLVKKALSGEDGLLFFRDFRPGLVLLDLNLPGIDGFEVAERLVESYPEKCPAIIMLTGRADEDDIVAGLERFADDYIVKPVQPRVLIARIQSVLRRSAAESHADAPDSSPIRMNRESFVVKVEGRPLRLTKSEFRILDLLMCSREKVLSREQIINAVKGFDCYVTERIVDFQICRIRKKLGKYADRIETVRGVGYKFTLGPNDTC
ncbi:MAG: response regulator transcription factor [Acidobacteria bacterium]|nr:response regulator transcription factor [Acidobacteriota bacterium]